VLVAYVTVVADIASAQTIISGENEIRPEQVDETLSAEDRDILANLYDHSEILLAIGRDDYANGNIGFVQDLNQLLLVFYHEAVAGLSSPTQINEQGRRTAMDFGFLFADPPDASYLQRATDRAVLSFLELRIENLRRLRQIRYDPDMTACARHLLTIEVIEEEFSDGDFRFVELLRTIAMSDGFFRAKTEGAQLSAHR